MLVARQSCGPTAARLQPPLGAASRPLDLSMGNGILPGQPPTPKAGSAPLGRSWKNVVQVCGCTALGLGTFLTQARKKPSRNHRLWKAVREASARPRLIVGLGNPGDRFRGTRHNAGFLAALAFSLTHEVELKEDEELQAEVGVTAIEGSDAPVVVMKPLTYLNSSGVSIAQIMQRPEFADLQASDCLVMMDDADLEVGRLRMKLKGGSGGHNGLKSIEKALGTAKYPRLKIGIGRPAKGGRIDADHVIGHVETEERQQIEDACGRAAAAAGRWVLAGDDHNRLSDVMTWCNTPVQRATK
eukprot:TRINITY_DN17268_c0_g1_i2.p1 TRINITY_DN17268_c0_g1~~TRINITY_DN17268_c0_g1_i2.p1  ORF type:complete len:300 (+),score=65.88 TRINITY_DN17268_c0_g1_i2:68-967(+)